MSATHLSSQLRRSLAGHLSLTLLALASCARVGIKDLPDNDTGPGQRDETIGDAAIDADGRLDASLVARDSGPRERDSARAAPDVAVAVSDPETSDDAGPSGPPGEPVVSADDASISAAPDARVRTGPATSYPGQWWNPPAPSYGATVENNIAIKMSDDVVLVGDVSYPKDLNTGKRATGEFPVLLTQNPYNALRSSSSPGEFFVTRGYIYASVDVRGSGRSAGTAEMFGEREAKDGAELVMWTTSLAGSNGKVGLHGCSQLGINQLQTATQLPPNSPVKAMIPQCLSGDFYRDTLTDNGIPGAMAPVMPTWAEMSAGNDQAYYREYWQRRDRVAQASKIAATGIPALLWVGWREGGSLGSLELYTALQNAAAGRPVTAPISAAHEVSGKYQVIIGDWGHAGGLNAGIELQWYDTWIKGLDTGLPTDTKTPLHLEERGRARRWINASAYPLVDAYTALFLSAEGALSPTAATSDGQDQLTWVAPGTAAGALEYVSAPFAEGALLAGPIAARLEVDSSNANLQLLVEVLDRSPEGTTARISHGSVLGSLRKKDAAKSWMGANGLPVRPYLALDEEQPLTPSEPVQLDVPLWPTVWSIEPRHSIVVRISTQPASSDCGLAVGPPPVGCSLTNPMRATLPGGVYTIHRSAARSSLLNLPLLPYGSLQSAKSAVPPTPAGPLSTALDLLGGVLGPRSDTRRDALPLEW